jgi:hypothetical protein
MDFKHSVCSLFGTYLRLMSVEEIETALRFVLKELRVNLKSCEMQFNYETDRDIKQGKSFVRMKHMRDIVKDLQRNNRRLH